MSTHENCNYRIATDILQDGRVKARAHGRKTNVKTFPVGTTPEDAARQLALKIEGYRLSHVAIASSNVADRADWNVYVTMESQPS